MTPNKYVIPIFFLFPPSNIQHCVQQKPNCHDSWKTNYLHCLNCTVVFNIWNFFYISSVMILDFPEIKLLL